jgi:hypothetical protein
MRNVRSRTAHGQLDLRPFNGTRAASELVYGKEVTLQTFGKDMYRHTIADVLLLDGINVNPALV